MTRLPLTSNTNLFNPASNPPSPRPAACIEPGAAPRPPLPADRRPPPTEADTSDRPQVAADWPLQVSSKEGTGFHVTLPSTLPIRGARWDAAAAAGRPGERGRWVKRVASSLLPASGRQSYAGGRRGRATDRVGPEVVCMCCVRRHCANVR